MLDENPFGLGVASGTAGPGSIVLWTRLHATGLFGRSQLPEAPVTLGWELADDEGFRRVTHQGQVQALPELAHSVHVELEGLSPGKAFFYRFTLGGRGQDWVSPVGRARTLAAADAPLDRLRLAYASCQRWEHGYYAAWRHLVADQPEFVLFLGDYIYEYPGAIDAVRSHSDGWTLSLDDYRRRYALHKSDPDLRAAHAACPWYLTWDDHEVQNDYAGMAPGDSGPSVPDFAARRAAAYQAFYEHMPLPARMLTRSIAGLRQGAELRLHSHVRLGRLGSLALLDTRQHKSPPICTRGGKPGASTIDPSRCSAWADPARTLLGVDQERWLDTHLSHQAGAGWTLIGQPTLFGPRDFRSGPGQSFWNDGWDGYPAARQRLIDALRRHRVDNPVLFGGDVHENWVGHIQADYADPAGASIGVEFCGTSISSRSGGNAKTAERLAENPHFVFADAQHKGYGLVELTPRRLDVWLRVVDDVRRADSGLQTLARFSVDAGSHRIERAG